MSTAAHPRTEIMSYRTHVGAGSYSRLEIAGVFIYGQNFELFNLNFDWLERDLLLLARQFVSADPGNFLGRIRRRHLLNLSLKFGGEPSELLQIQSDLV